MFVTCLSAYVRILLLSKPDPEILAALEKCLPYLVDAGLELYVEDSIYGQFQSLHDEREEGDSSVTVQEVISSNISDDSKVTSDISTIKIAVEKRVIELKVFDKESPRSQGVDLVIAFGGDGLLMHCNTLFGSGSIPPSMCFDFGSLGFLAPFDYKDFQEEVRVNFFLISFMHSLLSPINLRHP